MNSNIIDYIKHRSVIILLSLTALLLAVNLVTSLLMVHPQNFRVTSRYSVATQTVEGKGSWFSLYGFLAIALVSTAFNLLAVWKLVLIERTQVANAVMVATVFILSMTLLYGYTLLNLTNSQ